MRRFGWIAPLWLIPAVAFGQSFTADLELRRVKEGSGIEDRLSVYVVGMARQVDHDATFNIASTGRDSSGFGGAGAVRSADFVFRASGMEMQSRTPQVGLSYAASDRFLLYASAGPSWITLVERLAPAEFAPYANEHQLIFTTDLKPGFAGQLGGTFAAARFANFTVMTGLRLSYSSASSVRSDSVEGNISLRAGDNTFSESTVIDRIRTNDVSIHVLNATANAGLEWRPFASYLSNFFGVTAGYGFSFGSMTRSLRTSTTAGTTTTSTEDTDTVGFSMTPRNAVGVYYGWAAFLPRVGTFALQVRALDQLSGTLTYSYIF